MLSSDSQRLDLICFGSWLVTYAPTAAVGAASSLSPLKSLDSMLTPCMQICSRRLNVVGARVEWRRVPNFPTASWLAAALELGINLHWVEAKQSSLHARNIQWSFHPRE
jgi:hypothetical protein